VIYRFSIETPANTPKDSPKQLDVKLTKGIIHQLDVVFPDGCVGLVGVRILDGLFQVWPTNPMEWFCSNDESISFEESYELKHEPFTLRIEVYNEDDTLPHAPIVRLGILSRDELKGIWLPWYGEKYE